MADPVQQSSVQALIHLTDEQGAGRVNKERVLRGAHGIFAVPEYVQHEDEFWKVLRTGLPPSRTTHHVNIPDPAIQKFSRRIPIGPYSAWKYFGEVFVAPPGEIDQTNGTFKETKPWYGPRLILYGPDVLFYLALVAAVLNLLL
jgi:hypothetical protein